MKRRMGSIFAIIVSTTLTVMAQLNDKAYEETVGAVEYKDPKGVTDMTIENSNAETVWDFGGLGNILLIVLVVGILVFILYFIATKLNESKSNKKIDNALRFVEENLDDVEASEIEDQLTDSIQNKRYNQAVRLLFLKNLKSLNEKALIFWKKHKTNYTYTNELPMDFRNGFSSTAIWFDLARYSQHTVNADEFASIQQMMLDFHHQIDRYEQK